MKKVLSSCLGAVLFNNLFMIHLQKGSVDCISCINVSLGLSGLSFPVVSLLGSVSSGHFFLDSICISGCFDLLLVVTTLIMFIRVDFVPG